MMQTYRDFRPTQFDTAGAFLDDRQDWIVMPVSRTRDSHAFDRANFDAAIETLGGESETVEVHRFGHWGPGWFEIIIVDPSRTAEVEKIAARLETYPVLDDDRLCQYETDEANETWKRCYDAAERLAYIRQHRDQFEFHSWADLRACVRGEFFGGWAGDFLS